MPEAAEYQGEATFEELLAVVKRLRDPGGCPWDREQSHASLRQYLLEETYETLEAIESGEAQKLQEELGDLLTHIAFHADIASRAGEFDAARMLGAVIAKLVRRHPHVFGEGARLESAGQVVEQWEKIKRGEGGRESLVDGVPAAMPALALASALQKRAGKAGIVWEPADSGSLGGDGVMEREARAGAHLWAAVQRVMETGVDPETALRSVALRFRERVRRAEALAGGRHLGDLPVAERQRLWVEASESD
jgi:uncharacterized protein YabN with tetrapyrrole methylase and pyrophosphatase domain